MSRWRSAATLVATAVWLILGALLLLIGFVSGLISEIVAYAAIGLALASFLVALGTARNHKLTLVAAIPLSLTLVVLALYWISGPNELDNLVSAVLVLALGGLGGTFVALKWGWTAGLASKE